MVSESAGADPGWGHFLPLDLGSNPPHPDNRIAVGVGGPRTLFAMDLDLDGSLVWCSDDLHRRLPTLQDDADNSAALGDLARGARFLREDPEAVLTRHIQLGNEAWQARQARRDDLVRVDLRPLAEQSAADSALARVQERRAALQNLQLESGFLLRRSHALRTPMNAVIGMASLLTRSGLTEAQQEYVDIIRASGQVLLSVIDDILDFSRVEAGTLEARPAPFELRELVESSVRLFSLNAEQKGLDLVVDIAPEVPNHLIGDQRRLRQILINLVDNALRFTDEGKVELRVDLQVDLVEATPVTLRFSVTDTGMGIEPERLPRVFDSFFQMDERDRYRFGGAGLGLVISSRLAELFGDGLRVTSEVGQGSSFRFDASFLEVDEAEVAGMGSDASESPPQRKLRILVADDNPVNSLLAARILEGRQHEVVKARNGREALRAVQEGGIDLVLMDVQMPVMDGIEATRAIRQMEAANGAAEIPIVALTAEALELAYDRCMAAGMNACMSKPIDASTLFEAVEGLAAGVAART